MDPFTISMALAPLIMASARLTMLISAVKVGYNYAPETVTATWRESRVINIMTLSKIQELVYKNETDLFSKWNAQEPRRMTLAALNLELEKPVELHKDNGTGEFGFRAKARLVWTEVMMKQLLDQTRGQISSLRCLIDLLESETRAEFLNLLKQNRLRYGKFLTARDHDAQIKVSMMIGAPSNLPSSRLLMDSSHRMKPN